MATRITTRNLSEKVFPKKEHYGWLIQPAAFTFMRYDYSLMQQRIYATIIETLQKAFHDERNNVFWHGYPENRLLRENSWADFKKDFTEDDVAIEQARQSIPIKIMMKDFGIPTTQYNDLKRDFVNFGYAPVSLKILGVKDVVWAEYQGLCRMRIPENLRRVNRVYAIFTTSVAMEMFRALHAGYTTFMKEVILNSQSKYTPRIYMFLSAYSNKQSCFIPYDELRLYLRLDVRYKDFRFFKEDILNTARKELDNLFAEGLSNIRFTFEPVYDTVSYVSKSVVGINFVIERSDNIREIEIPYYDNMKKKSIFDLLARYCGCSDQSARHIVDTIKDENYHTAYQKIIELHDKFTSEFCKVSDMEAYTLKTFSNLLKDKVV